MSQIASVTVNTEANVYFDGKCVSHTIFLADGTRKSVGVILPGTLTFGTGAPEVMELVKGKCRVKRAGEGDWTTYEGGQQFSVPGNSSFDIDTVETLHYVCHFG